MQIPSIVNNDKIILPALGIYLELCLGWQSANHCVSTAHAHITSSSGVWHITFCVSLMFGLADAVICSNKCQTVTSVLRATLSKASRRWACMRNGSARGPCSDGTLLPLLQLRTKQISTLPQHSLSPVTTPSTVAMVPVTTPWQDHWLTPIWRALKGIDHICCVVSTEHCIHTNPRVHFLCSQAVLHYSVHFHDGPIICWLRIYLSVLNDFSC